MFAFALWDGGRQRLFAARDRFGIKPFSSSVNEHCMRFASNTRALLAAGDVTSAIDPVALHFQYTLHAVIPAPRTILRDIRKLEPAHSLTIVPDPVIDRPKGYFPMPALKYVRGEFLAFMRDILESTACRQRGIFDRQYVATLLAAPEMHHTRIMGSKLWHLALLEFWLQRHVDGLGGA
jgi:asparagine synthetase B (glutamine-hydrolysing)